MNADGKDKLPVPVLAIRQGAIDPAGAYFSTMGSSAYFDKDNAAACKYDISKANVIDSINQEQCIALIEETMKDLALIGGDRERLAEALEYARNGEPFIDYMLADDMPMAAAGKRLGYDGMRVFENDDWTDPSSVFIWNTHTVTLMPEAEFQRLLTEQTGESEVRLDEAKTKAVAEGLYSGQVLAIEPDGVAVQKINREGATVRHALSKLSAPVNVGDVVDIQYENGVGQVGGKSVGVER